MSYGLMVYSVNLDTVRQRFGSGDEAVYRTLLEREEDAIYSAGDLFEDWKEDDDEIGFTALHHLVFDEEKTLPGGLYAYVYKAVIKSYGTSLDNGPFYPASMEYLQENVQAALAATGATLRLNELILGQTLVRFPTPDDWPLCGLWEAEAVAQAAPLVQAATNPALEVAAIGEWLTLASARGDGIVGFYH